MTFSTGPVENLRWGSHRGLRANDTVWCYLSRLIVAACALLLMLGATVAPGAEPESLNSLRAYQLARSGKLLILDVRPRADWERGVPVGAVAVDKDQPLDAFISTIDRLALRNKGRRLAVICAVGIRSAEVQTILETAGYLRVLNVSDGVEGNTVGPGWIKRGLPMRRPSAKSIGAVQK